MICHGGNENKQRLVARRRTKDGMDGQTKLSTMHVPSASANKAMEIFFFRIVSQKGSVFLISFSAFNCLKEKKASRGYTKQRTEVW